MSLKDKAKAAAKKQFPKTAKTINALSSIANGQCGHCKTALKNSRCPNGCLG